MIHDARECTCPTLEEFEVLVRDLEGKLVKELIWRKNWNVQRVKGPSA